MSAPQATGKMGTELELAKVFAPLEGPQRPHVYTDEMTGAKYCEVNVRGSKIVSFGTIDTPLDPDEQPEYRANRDLVENAPAFARMKDDALKGRSFSGLVAEFVPDDPGGKPLKIVGGQHRFTAIEQAVAAGIDKLHGIKVYLDLTMEQRFDAQLISNTVIAVSSDLFDRMDETRSGPHLRDWCQAAGLLQAGEDFADRRVRGGAITVRAARTFIMNYFAGARIDTKKFEKVETTPVLSISGAVDEDWAKLKVDEPELWTDEKLLAAGKEYAKLIAAQRTHYKGKQDKVQVDFPEKATNFAVMAGWAFISGALKDNSPRLKRHFALADTKGKDPLNASALAKGRHKTDQENYRGLGYRTDAKERGRFAELFFLQAETGQSIAKGVIDLAIKKYHAKQAALEFEKAMAAASAMASDDDESLALDG